jgi:hypothetical protein
MSKFGHKCGRINFRQRGERPQSAQQLIEQRRASSAHQRGELIVLIMSRTKLLLVPAICALAVTFGGPALALNPQPLPPGFKAPPTFHGARTQIFCASGQHIPKFTAGRTAR